MKTETLNIESLIPYAKNSRTHSAEQVAQIASSIREFGWTNPVLIDSQGTIIAGHGRVMAARALNIVEIPCIRLTHLSESQIRAYVIADNKLALNAGWDEEMLNSELRALAEEGDIVKMTGFSDEELAELLLPPEAELTGDLDEVPEPPVDPITKAGDLWILGEHRVLCGDSTKTEDVNRVMGGAKCETLFYDPEWNIEFAPPPPIFKSILAFGDGSTIGKMFLMFGPPTWLFSWDCVTSWFTPNRPLRRMKICAWHGDINSFNLDGSHYGEPSQSKAVSNSRGSYDFKADPRGKHLSDVFQQPITKLHSESEHSHSKPIDWVRMLLADCTLGNVFDPFLGSGTTLIAAEQLGRKCYGIEISPVYCDVIVNRWQNATNKIAVHAVTGKPFNDRPAT